MADDHSSSDSDGSEELDRDALWAVREEHLSALNRIFEQLNDYDRFESFSVEELEVRKTRMQRRFDQFEQVHILYRRCTILATNDIFGKVEDRLMRLFARIDKRIKMLKDMEQNRNGHNRNDNEHSQPSASQPTDFNAFAAQAGLRNSTMNASGSIIRVEAPREPRIGHFDGTPADWPAFRDLFIAEVHSKDYDAVSKLLYLQNACTDRAAETLGPWQPIAANYQPAWDSMVATYDDEYHVIHGIFGRVYAVPRQESDVSASYRTILDSLNSGIRQLETIADRNVLWEQHWIHLAKQRMPKHALDSWEQHRHRIRPRRLPTLAEFQDFLDTKAKARQEFENESNVVKPSSNDKSNGGKLKSNPFGKNQKPSKPYDRQKGDQRSKIESNGFGPPSTCIMKGCSMTHYLGQCPDFGRLTMADRAEMVREHRLCRNCLTPGHMAFRCNRSTCSKCPESPMKHHYRLCPKSVATKPPNGDDKTKSQSQSK